MPTGVTITSRGYSLWLRRYVIISNPSFCQIKLCYQRQAEAIIAADETLDHEYLPITGLSEYTSAAAKLIIGADSAALKEGRVISVQTISGTGANHLGALFMSKFYYQGEPKKVYLSDPTWGKFQEAKRGLLLS